MTKRFYALWLSLLLLVIVLPITAPYAIWLPRGGLQSGQEAECARRAESEVRRATHPLASLLPLSSSVRLCEIDAATGALTYSATVTARGPYGIPIASGWAASHAVGPLTDDRGKVTLAIIAIATGMVLVSLPFAYAKVQHDARSRPHVRLHPSMMELPRALDERDGRGH